MTKIAATASNSRTDALIGAFERAGYRRIEPSILQPAEPFLDLSGEEIRKRMYLTVDPYGREMCLRPDLTIPVSRDYLASSEAGAPRGYCYLGPVFRHQINGPPEVTQAGIESFGRADITAADAEMLALGLEAAGLYNDSTIEIWMGDVGLFSALIAAIELAPAWKRRLIKDFNHKASLAQDLERLTISDAHSRSDYQGVLAALAGSDPKAAHALVTDLLSIAGIRAIGGRSVGEIADRFLEQSTLGAQTSLPGEICALIERFLSICGDPDEIASELRSLMRDADLKLDAALDRFESRTGFLAARGIDVRSIHCSTAFGRGLDYYTGFVFELHAPNSTDHGPLVAGGRYDGLLTRLGSPTPIPAVGFAVWIERLAACGGAR
jgi:ATP phosphoribosyltransferase regulatory subunit